MNAIHQHPKVNVISVSSNINSTAEQVLPHDQHFQFTVSETDDPPKKKHEIKNS